MKLWLIERDDVASYDEYDACVVAAKTEHEARETNPGGLLLYRWFEGDWQHRPRESDPWGRVPYGGNWPHIEKLIVKEIAAETPMPAGVILASFSPA